MKCSNNILKNENRRKGISSLFSVVFLILIVVVISVLAMNIAGPMIDEGRSYQRLNEAKQLMSLIDSTIRELVFEASGATRTLKLDIDAGSFIVSGKEDRIRYSLGTEVSIFEPGTRIKEGNLLITSGSAVRAYESDIDNNGSLDLVLENDAVQFSIRKIGNSTNYNFINTTSIILSIKNKNLNKNITPTTKLTIDGLDNSSYGNGYTEITVPGDYLTSSSIRLVMNSTANITYEALFTLSAAQDFVELDIRHIQVL